MTEKIRLNLNVDDLFPGETFTIGNQTITIRPLTISQLSLVVKRVQSMMGSLTEKGVTLDNFNQPDKLFDLTVIVLNEAPDLLSEATNLHIDDIKSLPFDIGIELVAVVLRVNLKSKETLEGNFKSLTSALDILTPKKQKTQPKSPKRSKN